VVALLTAWGLPARALACSVCFSAKDEAERLAITASTVFLTALPLILMGAFIAWAARRSQAIDARAQDSQAARSEGGAPDAAVLGTELLRAIALEPEPEPESASTEPSRVVALPTSGSDPVPSV
jgi:hypothetical protein